VKPLFLSSDTYIFAISNGKAVNIMNESNLAVSAIGKQGLIIRQLGQGTLTKLPNLKTPANVSSLY
jgi:hypothetical protein